MNLNPFTWFKSEPLYHVSLFMKSGNVIELFDITDVDYKMSGDAMVSLTILRGKDKWLTRLMVNSVDLSQIEAVTFRRTR